MDNPMFGSVTAFVVALGLFALAWAWNNHMRSSKFVGYLCVGIAVAGSVVLYASAPAMWLADKAVSIVNGIGDMLGAGDVSWWVMMLLCLGAFGYTVYDLLDDPEHNPGAVAALVIAPITAHGTLGVFHTIMEVVYGGLSLGTLDAIQRFGGGI